MPDKITILSGSLASDIAREYRANKGKRDPYPRAMGDSADGAIIQWVVLSSATPIGDYYPGHWYAYNAATQEWTQKASAWIFDPNAGALDTSTKYPAALVGFAEKLTAKTYTASLGASYSRTGDVITMSATGALGPFDGVTLATGDEILFNPGTADTGVWKLTQGDGSTKAKLTLDDVGPLVKVTAGTTHANTVWAFASADDEYAQVMSPPTDLNRAVWAVATDGSNQTAATENVFIVQYYTPTVLGVSYTYSGGNTITAVSSNVQFTTYDFIPLYVGDTILLNIHYGLPNGPQSGLWKCTADGTSFSTAKLERIGEFGWDVGTLVIVRGGAYGMREFILNYASTIGSDKYAFFTAYGIKPSKTSILSDVVAAGTGSSTHNLTANYYTTFVGNGDPNAPGAFDVQKGKIKDVNAFVVGIEAQLNTNGPIWIKDTWGAGLSGDQTANGHLRLGPDNYGTSAADPSGSYWPYRADFQVSGHNSGVYGPFGATLNIQVDAGLQYGNYYGGLCALTLFSGYNTTTFVETLPDVQANPSHASKMYFSGCGPQIILVDNVSPILGYKPNPILGAGNDILGDPPVINTGGVFTTGQGYEFRGADGVDALGNKFRGGICYSVGSKPVKSPLAAIAWGAW